MPEAVDDDVLRPADARDEIASEHFRLAAHLQQSVASGGYHGAVRQGDDAVHGIADGLVAVDEAAVLVVDDPAFCREPHHAFGIEADVIYEVVVEVSGLVGRIPGQEILSGIAVEAVGRSEPQEAVGRLCDGIDAVVRKMI